MWLWLVHCASLGQDSVEIVPSVDVATNFSMVSSNRHHCSELPANSTVIPEHVQPSTSATLQLARLMLVRYYKITVLMTSSVRSIPPSPLSSVVISEATPLPPRWYVICGCPHSYYGRRIGNRTQAFKWHQLQWHWVTSKPDFKVTILFSVK